MANTGSVSTVENELKPHFDELTRMQATIRNKLLAHADGKQLKGNELVGWLGEIYGKLLLGGRLVDDTQEHDIETPDGRRISAKARKGRGSGWQRSSAIPKIEGDDCPTHLLFVHLNNDYSIDRMWLYEWTFLKQKGRFKPHIVRGRQRSYVFFLDERGDHNFVVYPESAQGPSPEDVGRG